MSGVVSSRKGSALIFVVLICAALLFLGTSLLDLNSVDLKIAANQRDSLQAYYLAETGIETALAVLTDYDPYYVGSAKMSLAGGSISVDVSALEQGNGGRQISVLSTGRAGPVQETISVQFQSFPAQPGGTDGAALGWYDAASGVITPGLYMEEKGTVILGSPGTASPLILYGGAVGGSTFFAAEQIYFRSLPNSLWSEEFLELHTGITVFRGRVVLSPPGGMLRFSHPGSGAVRVYFQDGAMKADHRLLLEPGVYSFPHGFQLTGDTQPGEVANHRVLPVVPGTMIRRDGR
ncbi:MAG: pilus assembly PilX N-terminal domain-containing protein [Bacillota bacterium]